MATLYIEPFGGMAGDMLLAALCDLRDPRFGLADLEALVRELVPGECALSLERAWRGNLSGSLLDVRTDETAHPPHRHHADLVELLGRARSLSPAARERAGRVLWRIAEAEARVHGTVPEEIHFHEVGAVDTLVDVAGAALALERLGVERVVCGVPLTGTGTVRCAHGEMPVPAPAVAEILRGRELLVAGGGGERLTPTGAALLAELAPAFGAPGAFRAERIGYGAGHKDPETGPPNLVRVQLGELAEDGEAPAGDALALVPAWQLEVQLDDVTGEELGAALEALRTAGALDVWAVPVQMKKGRPGTLVCALCRDEDRERLATLVLAATPTLGLRFVRAERIECARGTLTVELAGDLEGERVRVKVRERPARLGGGTLDERDLSPEHDDLARIAAATGAGLRALERRAVAAALDALAHGARPT